MNKDVAELPVVLFSPAALPDLHESRIGTQEVASALELRNRVFLWRRALHGQRRRPESGSYFSQAKTRFL